MLGGGGIAGGVASANMSAQTQATVPIIDTHIHLYSSRQEGEWWKAGYEIWEYGAKEGVVFSRSSGTVGDALAEQARLSVRGIADLERGARRELRQRAAALPGQAPERLLQGIRHASPAADSSAVAVVVMVT